MRPQPPPPPATPAGLSRQRLCADAAALCAVLRARRGVGTVSWRVSDALDDAALTVELADGGVLFVALTCARMYAKGKAEGCVAFSVGAGMGVVGSRAEAEVFMELRDGRLWEWVATALEVLERFGGGRWVGCRGVAKVVRTDFGGCEPVRTAGSVRRDGLLGDWEMGRVQAAVKEARRFGYTAEWDVWEEEGEDADGACVEVRINLGVEELELGGAEVASWDLEGGERVQVEAVFRDGFRTGYEWTLGAQEVQFRVRVVDGDGKEAAEAKGAREWGWRTVCRGLERVLNGEFCEMARRRRASDVPARWPTVRCASGERGQLPALEGEADEDAAERGNVALMALRWVRCELLRVLDHCVSCRAPLVGCMGVVCPIWMRTCDREVCRAREQRSCGRGGVVARGFGSLEAEVLRDPLAADLLISMVYATVATVQMPEDVPRLADAMVFYQPNVDLLDPGPPAMEARAREGEAPSRLVEDVEKKLRRSKEPMLTRVSYATLKCVLDSIPSVDRLYAVAASGMSLENYLCEHAHPLAFGVLFWLLLSYKGLRLHCIQHESDRVRSRRRGNSKQSVSLWTGSETHEMLSTSWQFFVEPHASEKEARFATEKLMWGGSAFAFHGSTFQRWWSILHHALDFEEVRGGRAFGNGMYVHQMSLPMDSPPGFVTSQCLHSRAGDFAHIFGSEKLTISAFSFLSHTCTLFLLLASMLLSYFSPFLSKALSYACPADKDAMWPESLIRGSACSGVFEIVDSPADRSFVCNMQDVLVINATDNIALRYLVCKAEGTLSEAVNRIRCAGTSPPTAYLPLLPQAARDCDAGKAVAESVKPSDCEEEQVRGDPGAGLAGNGARSASDIQHVGDAKIPECAKRARYAATSSYRLEGPPALEGVTCSGQQFPVHAAVASLPPRAVPCNGRNGDTHSAERESGDSSGPDFVPSLFKLRWRLRPHLLSGRCAPGFEEPDAVFSEENRVVAFARYPLLHGRREGGQDRVARFTAISLDTGVTLAGTWRTPENVHIPIPGNVRIPIPEYLVTSSGGRRERVGLVPCLATEHVEGE